MLMPMARLEQKPIDLGVFRYHFKIVLIFVNETLILDCSPIILVFFFSLLVAFYLILFMKTEKQHDAEMSDAMKRVCASPICRGYFSKIKLEDN
jgi:hypothetical protein